MSYRIPLIAVLALILFTGSGEKPADYSKVLPGVVKVNDFLYYDKTETSNFYWLEYLDWQAITYGKDSAQYKAALPDTTVWSNERSYNQPYVKWYLRHAAYRDYPVVGVTWQQARDFCAWRTERAREYLEESGKIEKAPQYFAYRLPTREEWQMMWDDELRVELTREQELPKNRRGGHHYNLRRGPEDRMAEAGKLDDNADVTAPVSAYWPNSFGVYNIRGNVAEWLMDDDVAAGGGWFMTEEELAASQVLTATGSSAMIGFRCVCEVAEEAP